MKKKLCYLSIISFLYTQKKKYACVSKWQEKKSGTAGSTLVDTMHNFFSDWTLADTTLAYITHADTIHLQIP